MITLNWNALILGITLFLATVAISFLIDSCRNKKNVGELDKRLQLEKDEISTEKKDNKKLPIFDRIQSNLEEAEMEMTVLGLIGLCFAIGIVMFGITVAIFKQPIIGLAPLPFAFYFLPTILIENKKKQAYEKFDTELIMVFRRMSAVLKSGSILQALEDVKDLNTLSLKMRLMLNEVHHRFKYGEAIETAFYKASEKIPSRYLYDAVVSIDINKELGADLSNTLEKLSEDIKDTQLSEKESKSLMASTMAIGNILSVAPFLILFYMAYTQPTYFESYLQDSTNQIIFLALISWIFVGIFVIRKQAANIE